MRPLSSRSAVLYRLSVALRRFQRHLIWRFDGLPDVLDKRSTPLEYSLAKHRSLLLRKLEGTNMELQRNKVKSLQIACSIMNTVVINPGETFSFWRIVGRPSASRGFPPGLQLSFGSLVSMEGGGLCQLSNLLHWMVLHTPLTVVERHRHSTDPFPDYRRTVPFGTGATVFYNYLDFVFRNHTGYTFQILVSIGSEYLRGEVRCSELPPFAFSVEERNHRFQAHDVFVYRMNEIWRLTKNRLTGETEREELLMKNRCRILYDVPDEALS